jgi:hypothetical protein
LQGTFREELTYKGLKTRYGFVVSVGIYVAEIVYDDDLLSFGATNLRDLVHLMQETIDSYIVQNSMVIEAEVV